MEQQEDGTFRLYRMVPPKPIQYFYSTGEESQFVAGA
jgi:hypothetical protein